MISTLEIDRKEIFTMSNTTVLFSAAAEAMTASALSGQALASATLKADENFYLSAVRTAEAVDGSNVKDFASYLLAEIEAGRLVKSQVITAQSTIGYHAMTGRVLQAFEGGMPLVQTKYGTHKAPLSDLQTAVKNATNPVVAKLIESAKPGTTLAEIYAKIVRNAKVAKPAAGEAEVKPAKVTAPADLIANLASIAAGLVKRADEMSADDHAALASVVATLQGVRPIAAVA